MPRKSLLCSALALAIVAGAGARAGSMALRAPHRYLPHLLDGALVEVYNPVNGQTWAAWAYRSGAEYDLAVTVNYGNGLWSEPVFIGSRDGIDQIQPSLAVDSGGNLYLAFTTGRSGRVFVSNLPRGSVAWSTPAPVALARARGFSPALRIIGDRLVLAYRSGTGVEITELPLVGPVGSTGIQDGPDGFPLPGVGP